MTPKNKYLFRPGIIALLCVLFIFFNCSEKNAHDGKARKSAEWIQDAIVYEVNIRAFSKEGTFQTLETQITRLKKLGVTVVSLLPIHPMGELNRKGKFGSSFAVRDFYDVNPEFGTLEDFRTLVKMLHMHELKIILELPVCGTAWDSQVLMEHPDWFQHNAEGAIISPHPDLYDVAQLDFNQHEPKKYMIAVLKYWVGNFDVDGFLCDMDESIPINFWNTARAELEAIKPVMMISKKSFPEYHLKAFDITYSWNIFNLFPGILDNSVSASVLYDSLNAEFSQFPLESLRLRFLNTYLDHDQVVERYNATRSKMMAVLSFTMPGIPMICNGEEVGMSHFDLLDKDTIEWSDRNDFSSLYRKLTFLRKNYDALQRGSFTPISNSNDKKVYSILRFAGNDALIVLANLKEEENNINFRIPSGLPNIWKDQFSGMKYQAKDASLNMTLLPFDYLILTPEQGENGR